MQDIFQEISQWVVKGEAFALATVVKTWGSAPRQPGSAMMVAANMQVAGSVSGGCVEGAVVEEALQVLKSGQPKLLHYGVADELAWEVGLACGGSIDVFVERLNW